MINDLGPFHWINRRGFGAAEGVITPTLGGVGAVFNDALPLQQTDWLPNPFFGCRMGRGLAAVSQPSGIAALKGDSQQME